MCVRKTNLSMIQGKKIHVRHVQHLWLDKYVLYLKWKTPLCVCLWIPITSCLQPVKCKSQPTDDTIHYRETLGTVGHIRWPSTDIWSVPYKTLAKEFIVKILPTETCRNLEILFCETYRCLLLEKTDASPNDIWPWPLTPAHCLGVEKKLC